MKFLFGESVKKTKSKEEAVKTGCFSRLCTRCQKTGSNMGDSVLAMEIETLKKLLKEVIKKIATEMFLNSVTDAPLTQKFVRCHRNVFSDVDKFLLDCKEHELSTISCPQTD